MQLDNGKKKKTRISLTPLIDVVFLLLIFFMMASTFSKFSSLPLAAKIQQGSAKSEARLILVRVGADQSIDVNGKKITKDQLIETINEQAGEGGVGEGQINEQKIKLVIKPIEGAKVQDLVSIVEQARQSKLKNPVIVR